MSQLTIANISQSFSHTITETTAGIDTVWRNYAAVSLCINSSDRSR